MWCVSGSTVSCGPGDSWARSCWANGSLQPKPLQPRTAWGSWTSTVSGCSFKADFRELTMTLRCCFFSFVFFFKIRTRFFFPQWWSSRSSPVQLAGLEQHLPAVAAPTTTWPQWVTAGFTTSADFKCLLLSPRTYFSLYLFFFLIWEGQREFWWKCCDEMRCLYL